MVKENCFMKRWELDKTPNTVMLLLMLWQKIYIPRGNRSTSLQKDQEKKDDVLKRPNHKNNGWMI